MTTEQENIKFALELGIIDWEEAKYLLEQLSSCQ